MFTSSSHLPLPTQASPGQFFNFSSGGSMIPSQSPPSKSHLKVQKCEFSGYFCQFLAIYTPWSVADSITFSISNPLGSNAIGNIISIIFISDWIGGCTLLLSRNYDFVKKNVLFVFFFLNKGGKLTHVIITSRLDAFTLNAKVINDIFFATILAIKVTF